MVEDVRELEVESLIGEGLRVEVTSHHKRRPGDEVDAEGVGDSDAAEGGDLLADAGAEAEGLGGIGEEAAAREAGEEGGEDADLAVPVAGGPDLAELGVEGFVKLVVDVGFIGGVAASDAEIGG